MFASARCGTSCFGETPRFSGSVGTARTRSLSAGVRAFLGRWIGPCRSSSRFGSRRQRCSVRSEIPTMRHALASRAPATSASPIAARINCRSPRGCRRRPPTSGPLIFQDQQCRRLGQRLLFAGELTLELPDPFRRCSRRGRVVAEGQLPLFELGEHQALPLKQRREGGSIGRRGLVEPGSCPPQTTPSNCASQLPRPGGYEPRAASGRASLRRCLYRVRPDVRSRLLHRSCVRSFSVGTEERTAWFTHHPRSRPPALEEGDNNRDAGGPRLDREILEAPRATWIATS